QFKSKWGAEVKVIYRYSYLTGSHPTTPHHPVVSRTTTSTPNQPKRSAVRQLVFPLWQHLPLKAIELVGNGCHDLHYYYQGKFLQLSLLHRITSTCLARVSP